MWNDKKYDPVYVALFGLALTMLGRIASKVEVSKRHWVWLGSESTNGAHRTPTIKFGDTPMAVRRVLAMAMGKHPGGASRLVAACRCTTASCVSPHCVIVTTRRNAIRKGLASMPPARRAAWEEVRKLAAHRSPRTRLSRSAVVQIREAPAEVTNIELARRFGVAPSTISKARRGTNWASVPRTLAPVSPLQAMAAALTQC